MSQRGGIILKELKKLGVVNWDYNEDVVNADSSYDVYDEGQFNITLKLKSETNNNVVKDLLLERKVLRLKRDFINEILINKNMGTGSTEQKNNMEVSKNLFIKGYNSKGDLIGTLKDLDTKYEVGYLWYSSNTGAQSAWESFRDIKAQIQDGSERYEYDEVGNSVEILELYMGEKLVSIWHNPIRVDLFDKDDNHLGGASTDYKDFDLLSEVSDNMFDDVFLNIRHDYPEVRMARFTSQDNSRYTVSQD